MKISEIKEVINSSAMSTDMLLDGVIECLDFQEQFDRELHSNILDGRYQVGVSDTHLDVAFIDGSLFIDDGV